MSETEILWPLDDPTLEGAWEDAVFLAGRDPDDRSEPEPECPPYAEALDYRFRYKVLYGGRGGARSWTVARKLLARARREPIRVLCAREIQASIRDSVHQLLRDQIALLGYRGFEVTDKTISHVNGSSFIFRGLRHNAQEIKSLEGIDVCWVEEAQAISEDSWDLLTPTIRKDDSEIIITFNPDLETDPTYRNFVLDPPDDALVMKVTWRDNPFLPEVLRKEKDEKQRRDLDGYNYVWEGTPWSRSDAQVLGGKVRVEDFVPSESWDGPYFGSDFGFARDPNVLVKLWVGDNRLWMEHCVGGIELMSKETHELFTSVPGAADHTIMGDNARPETIAELNRLGLRMEGAEKWPGSVEDGIQHLRDYEEIVVHPRCALAIEEARLWRYKTDRLTGSVLPALIEGNEHSWDATRYALGKLIRRRTPFVFAA